MDDQNAGAGREMNNRECRPPVEADLASLCRQLNQRGAKYVVVGGFAVISAGYPRFTGDVDLIVAKDLENEAKVFSALSEGVTKAVITKHPFIGKNADFRFCRADGRFD